MSSFDYKDNPLDASFEALFSRYAKGLLVYAREFVRSREEAEDIVQDVFVNVWEKLGKLHGDTAKSYLFRSTRNGCLNHLEKLSVRSRYQDEILEKGVPPGALDPDMYVGVDLRAHIDKAVANLPPQQQRAFIMNKFEGKTYLEIAAAFEISPRTVEKHVEVASKSLRKDLAEYLYILFAGFAAMR